MNYKRRREFFVRTYGEVSEQLQGRLQVFVRQELVRTQVHLHRNQSDVSDSLQELVSGGFHAAATKPQLLCRFVRLLAQTELKLVWSQEEDDEARDSPSSARIAL